MDETTVNAEANSQFLANLKACVTASIEDEIKFLTLQRDVLSLSQEFDRLSPAGKKHFAAAILVHLDIVRERVRAGAA